MAMKIGLIYFSPAENTAKIAAAIKIVLENLNNDVEEFNVTNYSERSKPINLEQRVLNFLVTFH
jgi:flavodoxin